MIISRKLSKAALILITMTAVIVFILANKTLRLDKWYFYKVDAASTMYDAEVVIAREAKKLGIKLRSANIKKIKQFNIAPERFEVIGYLIGVGSSPVTTSEGALYSKIACADPNFAAIVVQLLKEAGVNRKDTVAVSLSGSLPGVDIAVLSACKAMELEAIIISSLGASTWGATYPELTWLDMERILNEQGIFEYRSVAASLGGFWDIQRKKSEPEKEMLLDIIKRNNLPIVYDEQVVENTKRRMQIYGEYAGAEPIKAFINVGGNSAVVGRRKYRKYIPAGLFYSLPLEKFPRKAVIMYMVEQSVPVINLVKIKQFVKKYELSPFSAPFPDIGKGPLYRDRAYGVAVSGIALLLIILFSALIIWIDVFIRREK